MQLIDKPYIYFLIPFLLTILVTPVVIRLAIRFDCVDKPGKEEFTNILLRDGAVLHFYGVMPVFFFAD